MLKVTDVWIVRKHNHNQVFTGKVFPVLNFSLKKIGHVALSLCFIARLSWKPLAIFTRKVLHLATGASGYLLSIGDVSMSIAILEIRVSQNLAKLGGGGGGKPIRVGRTGEK